MYYQLLANLNFILNGLNKFSCLMISNFNILTSMRSGISSSLCQEREETLEVYIARILVDDDNAGLLFN